MGLGKLDLSLSFEYIASQSLLLLLLPLFLMKKTDTYLEQLETMWESHHTEVTITTISWLCFLQDNFFHQSM